MVTEFTRGYKDGASATLNQFEAWADNISDSGDEYSQIISNQILKVCRTLRKQLKELKCSSEASHEQ